jgi:hypothetical protein
MQSATTARGWGRRAAEIGRELEMVVMEFVEKRDSVRERKRWRRRDRLANRG